MIHIESQWFTVIHGDALWFSVCVTRVCVCVCDYVCVCVISACVRVWLVCVCVISVISVISVCLVWLVCVLSGWWLVLSACSLCVLRYA